MIISRTPYRLSFFGGGTDYPEYFKLHGGQTLGLTINKYSYLTVKRNTHTCDYVTRVSYSKTELINDIADRNFDKKVERTKIDL